MPIHMIGIPCLLPKFQNSGKPTPFGISVISRLSCAPWRFMKGILHRMVEMCEQYLDLSVAPADTAFGLMADYDLDPHPSKVSLIAGAYRDENGSPWVLPSVQQVCGYLTFKWCQN